jgi:hypothetical protein
MDYSKHTDNNSKGTCNCCGKSLTDPVSVDLGIGPICRVNKKIEELQEKTSNLFANRSQYDWGITPDGKVLYITDEGGLKSVTNDLENVLRDIADEMSVEMLRNTRIMYRDSMGIWDGVTIEFCSDQEQIIHGIHFFPITEKEFEPAKEKLMNINI